jgi:ABC-type nickel/cobalt efflux system permease component RcnA
MQASLTSAVLRSPLLWVGLLLLAALLAALAFSDGLAELAHFSARYQRSIQHSLSVSLQDIRAGGEALALWAMLAVCFGYGVVHTLGPGHGKAVVVAYFLDSTRPRAWIEGLLAGGWIALTHTVAALLLAGVVKFVGTFGLFGALREVRNVEIVSYSLILAIGCWRLWAGLTGRLHEHSHGHHLHAKRGLPQGGDLLRPSPLMPHECEPAGPRSNERQRAVAGWLLLTAAGIAPCAGALVMILLAVAMGLLWAGVLGVLAIALGMALTLGAIGIASMAAHRLIIGEGRSREIGRLTSIAASLIVIVTAGILLLGALQNLIR